MQLDLDTYLDLTLLEGAPSGTLGVAVSGGGDSVAMLHLLHQWAGRPLSVVTVDHGLREESAAEATAVATLAESLGLPHAVLEWRDWNGRGNLQDAARMARRELIADWAARSGVEAVALGHTADDQAETFLMRLARGSGVDGLASMSPMHAEAGVTWVRPMLHVRREALRTYLANIGAAYVNDPSNEDESYDRVKVRRALGTLGALGIDVPNITKTTQRLRSAKQVLFTAARDLSLASSTLSELGELRIDTVSLLSGQPAIRLRILSEALRFVSGSYYAPRAYAVEAIIGDLETGFSATTLHGCVLRREEDTLVVRREPGRTGPAVGINALWDEKWRVTGIAGDDLKVDALGDAGLEHCKGLYAATTTKEALLTTPAVWNGSELLAAPLAGRPNGTVAELCSRSPFFTQ